MKNGKDICYIKPDKDFIAFGFGEVVNPAREEGAHMHPVAPHPIVYLPLFPLAWMVIAGKWMLVRP